LKLFSNSFQVAFYDESAFQYDFTVATERFFTQGDIFAEYHKTCIFY